MIDHRVDGQPPVDRLSVAGGPHPYRPVLGGGRQSLAVRVERDPGQRAVVFQGVSPGPGGRIPDARGAIGRRCGDRLPVGTVSDVPHPAGVRQGRGGGPAVLVIPQISLVPIGPGEDAPSVRREDGVANLRLVETRPDQVRHLGEGPGDPRPMSGVGGRIGMVLLPRPVEPEEGRGDVAVVLVSDAGEDVETRQSFPRLLGRSLGGLSRDGGSDRGGLGFFSRKVASRSRSTALPRSFSARTA